jgi:hypothetical protein
MPDQMNDQITAPRTAQNSDQNCGPALAGGRWEPCLTFAPDGAGSPVCGDCGWLFDDHGGSAVVRRLPVRAPRSAQPRRLAS